MHDEHLSGQNVSSFIESNIKYTKKNREIGSFSFCHTEDFYYLTYSQNNDKITINRNERFVKGGIEKLIRHKEFSPTAHNLGHIPEGKTKTTKSIGMFETGRHDYGIIERVEIIQVISGHLNINGKMYNPGEICTINPGTRVVFETEDVVCRYICDFPGEYR